uniref:EF-hand domain-containing protein n=1 Tax=Aplanochytrium stocchinoi TaxID=215587 RepID=A0A7S3PCL5_9STRA
MICSFPFHTCTGLYTKELDTDGNGYLDPNELRTLASVMSDGNNVQEQFEEILLCLHVNSADMDAIDHARMDLPSFLNCSKATEGVLQNSRRKRTHEIIAEEVASEFVSFEMIDDNFTTTMQKLDSIRKKKSKFICINDDMKKAPLRTRQAVHHFYNALFPKPSQFELEPGYRNVFLYYDEYVEYINVLHRQNFYIRLGLGILFLGVVFLFIYN